MNTKIRLSISLGIAWVLLVIAYIAFDFISVPASSCNYFIPELLGGAAPPALEVNLQIYKSFFLSCGLYTDIMYTSTSNYSKDIFIVSNNLQLIEINIVHVLLMTIIPPALIASLIFAAQPCITWIKGGAKYDN